MKVFTNRISIIAGLSVVVLLTYCSGLGHFLINKTVISYIPGYASTNVDNITVSANKSSPPTTTIDNRASSTNKLGLSSTNVDKRTVKAVNSRSTSTNVNNRTTVIYTSLRGPTTVITSTTPASTASTTPANVTNYNNKTLYVTSSYFRKGRLGNQMTRYAALLGISRAQGRTLIIPPVSELQNTFKIRHVENLNDSAGWLYISEALPYEFDPQLMKLPLQNVKLDGYFQTFLYFKNVEDEVRQDFSFHDNIAKDAASILRDVKTKYGPSLIVGVHVRRGDFVSNQRYGYVVPEKSYFFNAFNWMKLKFSGENITFIIASDDLKWCNHNLVGNGAIVLPQAAPAVHLAVMASCDHVIMSSGSYGWWCGWLAGGKVIYYKEFMRNDTVIGQFFNSKTYYPPLWIGMGN